MHDSGYVWKTKDSVCKVKVLHVLVNEQENHKQADRWSLHANTCSGKKEVSGHFAWLSPLKHDNLIKVTPKIIGQNDKGYHKI